jgi:hypothetical protein
MTALASRADIPTFAAPQPRVVMGGSALSTVANTAAVTSATRILRVMPGA